MILLGQRDSISDITIDNLHENFDLFYHPSQMHLLVIGKFDVDPSITSLKKYDQISPLHRSKMERFPVEKKK